VASYRGFHSTCAQKAHAGCTTAHRLTRPVRELWLAVMDSSADQPSRIHPSKNSVAMRTCTQHVRVRSRLPLTAAANTRCSRQALTCVAARWSRASTRTNHAQSISLGLATRRVSATLHGMRQPVLGTRTTTIVLCRHGESEGNLERRFGGHSPTPLSDHGRVQARAAGRALARLGIDVIYTSDLVRAAQTADLISEATRVMPHTTTALRERSVGRLTDLTFAEAEARFPDDYAALLRMESGVCPPGGETYAACRTRAAACLEQALSEHAGQRVLFVSHNLTVTQLILHILGLGEDSAPTRLLFQIDHCALHTFERNANGGWKVVSLNDRAHLIE
jgi:probable phosphoglycerate mutase